LIAQDWFQKATSGFMRGFSRIAPRFAPGVSMMMLYLGFVPEATRGIDAVFEFHLEGRGGGIFTVIVNDGSCRVALGPSDTPPDVVYDLDASTWAELTAGYATGDEAVLLGKLRIRGDVILGRRFNEFFAPPGEPLIRAASQSPEPEPKRSLPDRLVGRVLGRGRAA
jgi:putative sterol carrier protein